MADFENWTLDDAIKAIDGAITKDLGGTEAFEANQKYAEDHDHWQGGTQWVGPGVGASESVWARIKGAIERQFTPYDAIGEVLGRRVSALTKTEAEITLVPLDSDKEPSEAQQKEIRDAVGHLSAWWDRVKLWSKVKEALTRQGWAGRGSLRVWIPQTYLVAKKEGEEERLRLPSGLAFDQALRRIALAAPAPDAAYRYVDPDTQREAAIVRYSEKVGDDERDVVELWWVEYDQSLDPGLTHYRRLVEGGEEAEIGSIDLQGRLPLAEMRGEPLITEPVRKQQARLNFFESLLVRVAETGGFPERYTHNASPQGIWLETPPAEGPPLETKEFKGKTWYLHPVPRTLGAAITTELRGFEYRTDDEGKRSITTPSVTFKEPTDPAYAIKAADHAHGRVLGQCHQGHIVLTAQGEASGIAYEQARADFDDDLNDQKGLAEGMVREILEAVIAKAETMGASGRKSLLDRYRVAVNLHVKSGPIAPEEKDSNSRQVKGGLLSRQSAMAKNGVEDVDAELQRIEEQPDSIIGLRKQQAELMTLLVGEGMGWESAALEAGIEPEDERMQRFKDLDAAVAAGRVQGRTQEDEIDRILAGTGAET